MKGWLFAAALFALTALAQTFQVASGEARYREREELLRVGLTDAAGTTYATVGTTMFYPAGWAFPGRANLGFGGSSIPVSLRATGTATDSDGLIQVTSARLAG